MLAERALCCVFKCRKSYSHARKAVRDPRCWEQALAISPRGEVYTTANVQERLATRNLMQQLRSSGLVLGGPASLSAADCQHFAAALDRSLTSLLNRINGLRQ